MKKGEYDKLTLAVRCLMNGEPGCDDYDSTCGLWEDGMDILNKLRQQYLIKRKKALPGSASVPTSTIAKKPQAAALQQTKVKTCPYCGSHKVELFDADNDICRKCNKWFPGS